MPFSRRFYPKRLTVMCAYILRMGGPGNRTHYPGVTSAMRHALPTELQKDHTEGTSTESMWRLYTGGIIYAI